MKLSKKVVLRFLQAGYSGWNPPEQADDPTPWEDWEEAVKLFPHKLQKLLQDPTSKETQHSGDLKVQLTAEFVLGKDENAGGTLTAIAWRGTDADEDGSYSTSSNEIDYNLWVGQKEFSSGETMQSLRHDLEKFKNELKEKDPEAYEEAGF